MRDHAVVEIKRLALTECQRQEIDSIYEGGKETYLRYSEDAADQSRAQALLALHYLDRHSREQLENRWNISWSNGWGIGKAGDSRRRILLQCSSGYCTESRHATEKKKAQRQPSKSSSDPWLRRNPYNFTGCLAHVELTERTSNGAVTSIVGCLEHNAACQKSTMQRLPAIPLHPHVYEVALKQLQDGASVASVQSRNLELMNSCSYRDMKNYNLSNANIRYQFLPSDISNLYRLYNKFHGVDVTLPPQYNLDNWLNPQSTFYKPEIRQAIFHYEARTQAGERLKVCISTAEMDAAAWKYAHHGQVILDGTFGVCSSRLLLFIAMGIDEAGKGVPLALFLFSAPAGNQATHAGYNRGILRELLSNWKCHLSCGHPNIFTPFVAITDTDTKERGALQDVWPEIWLLLCKFHLRQCWTNKRKSLKLVLVKKTDFWKNYVNGRLIDLEVRLLESMDLSAAQGLINKERSDIIAVGHSSGAAQAAADAGLQYLDYMSATWMPEALWQSWSQKGRTVAAMLLKIPIEGVLPTTNHLESFNCLLKRKYIPQWQRSGSRLRFDFLIVVLITRILPEIFSLRRSQSQYSSWLASRFKASTGGIDLMELRKEMAMFKSDAGKLCWWETDQPREDGATVVNQRRLLSVRQSVSTDQYEATCVSSSASIHNDPSRPIITYQLSLHRAGMGNCSCPDFANHGRACKHLRALRRHIDMWVQHQYIAPFHYPTTADAALAIRSSQQQAPLSPHNPALSTPSAPSSDQELITQATSTSAAVLNNLLVLQQLARDETSAADDDEIVSDREGRGIRDDFEGYSSDSGVPNSVSETPFQNMGQDAVTFQVQRQVEHAVASLLPRLHGLSVLVSESRLSRTDHVTEFQGLLDTLSSSLNRALPPSTDSISSISLDLPQQPSDVHPLTPSTHTEGGKRAQARLLLPPSPEQKQKRKTSHNVL